MNFVSVAKQDEADEIARLVNSAYRGESSRSGWTTEADYLDGQRTDAQTLRQMMENPQGAVLILRQVEDGPICGCVSVEKIKDQSCYLGMLTINPKMQAHGTGRFLLTEAENYAKKTWKVRRIVLGVIQIRDTLIAWYERRGYKKTGETQPFPYGELQFGIPKRSDLYFVMLEKKICR